MRYLNEKVTNGVYGNDCHQKNWWNQKLAMDEIKCWNGYLIFLLKLPVIPSCTPAGSQGSLVILLEQSLLSGVESGANFLRLDLKYSQQNNCTVEGWGVPDGGRVYLIPHTEFLWNRAFEHSNICCWCTDVFGSYKERTESTKTSMGECPTWWLAFTSAVFVRLAPGFFLFQLGRHHANVLGKCCIRVRYFRILYFFMLQAGFLGENRLDNNK